MLSYNEILVLVWVLWAVALTMTAFRGGMQWYIQRKLYADDYFVIFGMVSLTALSATITMLLPQFYLSGEYVQAAASNPLTPLPLPEEEFLARTITSLKFMFSQMLLFWTTLWAAKFSILFFVRRLLDGLPVYMRWWWACFTVVLLLYLACMVSNFLTCVPLDKYWSATGCSDPSNLVRADKSIKFATSADIIADVLIMILPLNLIRNLQITFSHKLGLVLIFSLGSIIIAFAFVRLAQVTRATSLSQQDPTTVADGPILLSMWSDIESAVSIIVATLPAFRFVLNIWRVRTGKATGYNSGRPVTSIARSKSRIVIGSTDRNQGRLIRLASQSERDPRKSLEFESQIELKPVPKIVRQMEYSIEVASTAPGSYERDQRQRMEAMFNN